MSQRLEEKKTREEREAVTAQKTGKCHDLGYFDEYVQSYIPNHNGGGITNDYLTVSFCFSL